MLHKNPYNLTSEDLESVKSELMGMVQSREIEPKDRISAAKELTRLVDQIYKYRPAEEPPQDETGGIELLKGLKIVSA